MSIRESLLPCIDDILEVREKTGALLAEVFMITRKWTGERPGDGDFSDKSERFSPQPGIRDYSHDVRVTEVGAVKAGDLILTGFSRNKYDEVFLLTKTKQKNLEKFYKVGDHYYRAVHVKEKLLTWDVHVRKIHKDETEKG